MENQELDLREIMELLLRRLWILIVLPVLATTTAGIYSAYFLTPIYQASSTVWIRGEPTGIVSYDQILTNRTMALTYSEIAHSRAVAFRSAELLGMAGITGDHLLGRVSASPVKETELLIFTGRDIDPEMAALKTNAIVAGFQQEIQESQMVQHVRIIDRARVPSGPVYPQPRKNMLIAFALGLMAAVGLAFLLEFLDTSLRNPEDVRRRLKTNVLGAIPLIAGMGEANAHFTPTSGLLHPILVTAHGSATGAAESFRVLRTNLQFLGMEKPLKSIQITSATPTEGKSVSSANLAIAMAQGGRQVLLVDADLRLPSQAKLFGLKNTVGLTTVLMGLFALSEVLHSPMPGLHVLPSGPIPPNPSELLGSPRMKALIHEMEAAYDYVILDSPPTLGLADAVALAPQVDGVILVIGANKVGWPSVARAKAALESVHASLLGMVLEGIRKEEEAYSYDHYYSNYYSHYYLQRGKAGQRHRSTFRWPASKAGD